jgi:zinc/manganese transport system substrate-binding protein
MRAVPLWTAALAGLGLVAACGSSPDPTRPAAGGSSGVSVVASTIVYGDVVRQIAGDKVGITSVISDPAQDPHSYEADTKTQLALSRARIVIENGGGYDDFMDTMLKSAHNSAATVLNVVDISGKTASAGGSLNEHVWYDFPTVGRLVDRLVDALSAADAADAATFRANAATFKQRLATLESTEAQVKAAHTGAGVAVTEPVPLYLLEACGLVNKTPAEFSEAIEEGNDVAVSVLKQTLDLFADHKVVALVYNEQTTGPVTEQALKAARDAGVPVVPVTETLPAGESYVSWMTSNLDRIAAAVQG